MATDVDVQFFSHLNGLTLGNNWGDLIRLLDKALVTGLDFTQITAATIDEQGDVHITLYAAHNTLLFQVVELSGFNPTSLNQKYRIKGVPNTTQLILKPALDIAERSITAVGTGKLASLGYEIVFRDTNDVKRVYRSKNPRAEHPFIRVDETISDGTNSYNSAYAKSAMVGLIENMTHIDDFEDISKLQLPLDITDFKKNWKITGTSTSIVRGWAKWYWANGNNMPNNANQESTIPATGNRSFTLIGDQDAFYLQLSPANLQANKLIVGCGLYNSSLQNDVIPNWFLMATMKSTSAEDTVERTPVLQDGAMPLVTNQISNRFFSPSYSILSRISNHALMYGVLPHTASGSTNTYGSNSVSALEIPCNSSDGYLRGTLKHICFAGKSIASNTITTPVISDLDMYVMDSLHTYNDNNIIGGVYYYLGGLE
ncbi:hypothetical protein [Acinetobacter radioresistens]|uniref:hypothetical protein n=1 Tax=Acinetobacter radioresistens TaxID=40216 RepID=UPI000E743503|nr:hypothetical protein [Acinetobacter radioresistens]RJL71967.1 hypothetical protein D5055_06875 [Acinetobacter radioresistens]